MVSHLRTSPWFDQRPERHLFFFMSGAGAAIAPSWRSLIGRSTFIVAEGDAQADFFRKAVDVVVPGKLSVTLPSSPIPAGERRLLAVFRGSLDAALRDGEGGRVRRENKLRRRLAKQLQAERGVVFSGKKSKRLVGGGGGLGCHGRSVGG